MTEFAKNNPQLTVYMRQRPGRHPRIVAEFRMYHYYYADATFCLSNKAHSVHTIPCSKWEQSCGLSEEHECGRGGWSY